MILAISLSFALIPVAFPDFYDVFPTGVQTVVASGITMGSLSAIILNLVFNVWGGKNNLVRRVVPTPQQDEKVSLDQVNDMSHEDFVETFGQIFQGPPWIADHAYSSRPFVDVYELRRAFHDALFEAPAERQLELIRAYPDLAGVATREHRLGSHSVLDQAFAGLDHLVTAPPGDDVVRCDGDIITAGFVNTHHHFYQWLTRGWVFDCSPFGWLRMLYPVWARIEPEDVEAAAAVALGELALTGCTTAADHHYMVPRGDDSVFDATARAAGRIGLRAHLARGSMDLSDNDLGWIEDVLDPVAGLVLGPERRARHVFVDGSYVVQDGQLVGAEMRELRQDLAQRARRLWPEDA